MNVGVVVSPNHGIQSRSYVMGRARICHTREREGRRACTGLRLLPAFLAFLGVSVLMARCASGQQQSAKTFASPGAAALALYDAAKTDDNAGLVAILGPGANDITHTGDEVADRNMRESFVNHYEQMHRVVVEPDGTATLYIGADNWPLPIPIVGDGHGGWRFDTESGKKEVLRRRVGKNENDVIETMHALVDAQLDYASRISGTSESKQYAMKFLSDEGQHNGLYWKAAAGEPQSPIGPLLVSAAKEGYIKQNQPSPFHGYYYRILTKQGSKVKGGRRNYMVNGKLTRGFAFVAYPAQYSNSGVMTFMVNQSGVVYQKDLGEKTSEIAAAMEDYDPGKTWTTVE